MTSEQIQKQQTAGQVAHDFFEELNGFIKPGVNLLDIEALAAKRIAGAGLKPAFLGYKGYPAVTCISVNSAIVHGIPYSHQLEEGDVVAVDIGINNDGWLVDTARTYGVGRITDQHQKLLDTTKLALEQAIEVCCEGNTVGDIGATVAACVKAAGFAVVKELSGHGVGKTLQEAPSIPNYGKPGTGPKLTSGMVIAVEPIIAVKPVEVVILQDGWTIAAREEVVSAHFEHTIAITESDPIILTKRL